MESNIVPIGQKDLKYYFPACFFVLGKSDTVKIVARGKNTKKALDLLAILMREYLDNSKYSIEVGSESFEVENDKERFVTTIEIELSGKRKIKK